MKTAIIIFILFAVSSIHACDNSPSGKCESVQVEIDKLLQSESEDCCGELCYCNCCSQISVLSLIMVQDICENYSTPIIYHSIKIF